MPRSLITQIMRRFLKKCWVKRKRTVSIMKRQAERSVKEKKKNDEATIKQKRKNDDEGESSHSGPQSPPSKKQNTTKPVHAGKKSSEISKKVMETPSFFIYWGYKNFRCNDSSLALFYVKFTEIRSD